MVKKATVYAIAALLIVGYFAGSESRTDSTTSGVSQSTAAPNATAETATPQSTVTKTSPPESALSGSVTETASPIPTQQQETTSGVTAQLSSLVIKGRAPKTGYDRDLFGSSWIDIDRNGCDTRNDILARDLTNETFRSGTNNCVVETGQGLDPYTGTSYAFQKSSTGGGMDIDHIVSLSDAWQKGAQQWNSETRKQFANDPLNLVTTDAGVNRQKSDSDAASWLPPNKEIRCAFIARQVAIKAAYQLWVTQAEYDAMARVLAGCPNQPTATSGQLVP